MSGSIVALAGIVFCTSVGCRFLRTCIWKDQINTEGGSNPPSLPASLVSFCILYLIEFYLPSTAYTDPPLPSPRPQVFFLSFSLPFEALPPILLMRVLLVSLSNSVNGLIIVSLVYLSCISSLHLAIRVSGHDQPIAPYKGISTHGFVLDEQGRKMSKSLGNVVSPQNIIEGIPYPSALNAEAETAPEGNGKRPRKAKGKSLQKGRFPAYGIDTLRFWVASVDSRYDVSIGPEVIAKVSDGMQKLRRTVRFLLGNLDDLESCHLVAYDELSLLDKATLHSLSQEIEELESSYSSHNYCAVVQQLLQ